MKTDSCEQRAEGTQARSRGRILLITQPFVPDPTAVGQHMADAARELVRRGYDVRVLTSENGYDNPKLRYPRRETIDGIDVRRLPYAAFGKGHLAVRALGALSFHVQALAHQLITPNLSGILFSTAPPLVGITSVTAGWVRRVPAVFWAMDLNPDQLIALEKIPPDGILAWSLEQANRVILSRSALIVALDRFMRERLLERGDHTKKIVIIAPWPQLEPDASAAGDHEANPFRLAHGLVGKRVIMYSGNHSPSNPLSTLLEAAVALKGEERLKFVFVGGGTGKREIERAIAEHGLVNVLSLPYQPLSTLKVSLSAGDVHVVAMGDAMRGIIHPCKIYGALAVGRPILYLGPTPSHVSDILQQHGCGWQVGHGDVAGMKKQLESILLTPTEELSRMGEAAQRAIQSQFGKAALMERMGDSLEQVFSPESVAFSPG